MMNLVATCCILLAFLSLSGCLHSVRLPDAEDREAVRTGEKVIVLFRHQSVYDSKPRETLGTYPTDGFGLEMGCLDDDDKPIVPVIFLSSPSEQARKEGWAYLVCPCRSGPEPARHRLDFHSGPVGAIEIDLLFGQVP